MADLAQYLLNKLMVLHSWLGNVQSLLSLLGRKQDIYFSYSAEKEAKKYASKMSPISL